MQPVDPELRWVLQEYMHLKIMIEQVVLADIKFDLYLFDIQTFTFLTVNKLLTSQELPDTAFVEGL